VGRVDVLDSAAAVAALVAELIEGDVEFIFSQFVALRRVASVSVLFSLRSGWSDSVVAQLLGRLPDTPQSGGFASGLVVGHGCSLRRVWRWRDGVESVAMAL